MCKPSSYGLQPVQYNPAAKTFNGQACVRGRARLPANASQKTVYLYNCYQHITLG